MYGVVDGSIVQWLGSMYNYCQWHTQDLKRSASGSNSSMLLKGMSLLLLLLVGNCIEFITWYNDAFWKVVYVLMRGVVGCEKQVFGYQIFTLYISVNTI